MQERLNSPLPDLKDTWLERMSFTSLFLIAGQQGTDATLTENKVVATPWKNSAMLKIFQWKKVT